MTNTDNTLQEERMARLMREATASMTVPVEDMVAQGHRRGVTKRRRRRIAQVAGTSVCAAAVVVGIAAVRPLAAPAPGLPDSQVSAASQPSAGAQRDAGPTGFGVPTRDMASVLASLLPQDGATTNLRTAGGPETTGGPGSGGVIGGQSPESIESLNPIESGDAMAYRTGSLIYDDGDGASAISVTVSAPDSIAPKGATADYQALCDDDGSICSTVPAGTLVTYQAADAGRGGTPGLVSTNAVLITDDGYTVAAAAFNAASEKGSTPTRNTPPLDNTRLGSVVTDPAWLS